MQRKAVRADADLGRMIVQIAQTVHADHVICCTYTGEVFPHVHGNSGSDGVMVATTSADTFDVLNFDALRLSIRVAYNCRQARHAASIVLNASKVSFGDVEVYAVGHDLC